MRLARPGAAQIPSGWQPKRSAKARLASSAPSVRSRRSVDIAPYLLDRAGLVSSTNRTMVDPPSKHSNPPGARPTENTCTTSLYRRFPVLVVHCAVGVGGLMEVMQVRRPLCRDHHFHFLGPSTRSPVPPGMGTLVGIRSLALPWHSEAYDGLRQEVAARKSGMGGRRGRG